MAKVINRYKKPIIVLARDWLPGHLYESVDNTVYIGTVKEKISGLITFGVDLTTGLFVFNPHCVGKVIQNTTLTVE